MTKYFNLKSEAGVLKTLIVYGGIMAAFAVSLYPAFIEVINS